MNVLLLATLFKLPYRVLRCAAAMPAEVCVLGGPGARGLESSTFCRRFVPAAAAIDGQPSEALAAEIDAVAQRLGIDAVIAADAPATRSLIASRPWLQTRCFPMPDLASFDLLNDKWRFGGLCQELGLARPATTLCDSLADLEAKLADWPESRALLAKPLDWDGGRGHVRLQGPRRRRAAARIDYQPILVQEFINGADLSASIHCREGAIRACVTQAYTRGLYTAYHDAGIHRQLTRIAASLRLEGMFNFDLRTDASGRVYFLECNPRVFFSMKMAALAGINFLRLGLAEAEAGEPLVAPQSPVRIHFPRAFASALRSPHSFRETAWPTLKFLLADPTPYVREKLGLEREHPPRTGQASGRQRPSLAHIEGARRERNISGMEALQIRRTGGAGA
ncbi:MAG TPA: ATP-grasp domain-containing protein [Caulobacteraceae bacterium]|nr:ATP-grasp domain-containing protein [Caulobacteraceae bacterium]